MGAVQPLPEPVVPATPDRESAPTLNLPTLPLAHRLENQRPTGRRLTPATPEPDLQDCSNDPMIDPMTAGTIERGSADLRRPRGREALSPHPPALVDNTSTGSLERRAETTPVPAALLPPETADPRKTAAWAWSKAKAVHRRRTAPTQSTLPPIDAIPDPCVLLGGRSSQRGQQRLKTDRIAGSQDPPDGSGERLRPRFDDRRRRTCRPAACEPACGRSLDTTAHRPTHRSRPPASCSPSSRHCKGRTAVNHKHKGSGH